MTSEERFRLDMGAMQRFDMDSIDVDNALEAAGLDDKTCTVEAAIEAVRKFARENGLPPYPLRFPFT